MSLWFQGGVAQMRPWQGAWIGWQFAARRPFSLDSPKTAHPARTHRALTPHSKHGVMWPRGPSSSISSMRPWERLAHVFRDSFYMLWEDARQQNWLPGSANIKRFYCALHALRGCQVTTLTPWKYLHSMFLVCFTRFARMLGDKLDSLRVHTFNVSIVFYTRWEDGGWQSWFSGSAQIQRFFNVLHALRGCRATKLILGSGHIQ